MNKEELLHVYNDWLKRADYDKDLNIELQKMNDVQIEDAFYKELSFGTGGLRGKIGAGTNRMNVYTVGKATQGLADYLNESAVENKSVVIGYDSRIKSDIFARHAARVFAANNIHVYLWKELLPVSTVSYATRYLHASAGVMITASHNPSVYNGYKVYGADGCQITTETAKMIFDKIKSVDIFDEVKEIDFDKAIDRKLIEYIKPEVLDSFIEDVKKQSVVKEKIDRNVAIVYSPLNGTGRVPVQRVLNECGFNNITFVKEQELPDGNFPTCPYPNPEIREAMSLGIEYAKRNKADLLIATDPDCDRCGIAVKNKDDYQLLSGNETGMLLLDFICSQRVKNSTMPEMPIMVKTIVTTDMGKQIADSYGVETIDVLTGFKFIGEQIGYLDKKGEVERYIFGFEESYGYLSGGYVRDKDAVGAALLIAEMFAYYKTKGISLLDKLEELYKKFGYRLNTLHSYEFDGAAGLEKMLEIMKTFRYSKENYAGIPVEEKLDYLNGIGDLPVSNVIKCNLRNNSSVVIRPSGTEPKLKLYISISANSMGEAEKIEKQVVEDCEELIK